MSDGQDETLGTAWSGPESGGINDWSLRVYRALQDWPGAVDGQWTRWEPGYLLLVITQVGEAGILPVQLYTADEEVTVEFGYWQSHLSYDDIAYGETAEDAPEAVARHAKVLVQRWLDGELKTAVFSRADGAWCGTTLIEPENFESQIREAAQRMRNHQPVQAELRSVHEADWQRFAVDPVWLVPPKLPPDRLP